GLRRLAGCGYPDESIIYQFRGNAGSPSDGRPSKLCATLDLSRRLRMDGISPAISPSELCDQLGTASAPVLIDVRPHDSFFADNRLIVGAFHRVPADVEHWWRDLPVGRPVVAYCGHGGTSSQRVASALHLSGIA